MLDDNEKYKDFFRKIHKFKEIQDKQKQRGLNDFNLLTTVRKYHDEVYLHSAMIGALLNPHGAHYQKTLFLELFLETIGLHNWDLNLDNISVHVEYKDIDLYITDGVKHIIIENKIFAEDQPCQLIKYINIIVEENKNHFKNIQENAKLDDKYLQVVYLTAQSKVLPDEHTVENDYIEFSGDLKKLEECSNREQTKLFVPNGLNNYKVKYQRITYKKEILEWLKSSKKEVENITNLNEAIKQYRYVAEMVNNNYKGKVMGLKEYMLKNEVQFEDLKDIVNQYNNMMDEAKSFYLSSLEEEMKTKYPNSYPDGHIKIPITSDIILQTGIEGKKTFITLYKTNWAEIDIDEKNKIFSKIQDININEKTFTKPSWKGYATVNILEVDSKQFLDVKINIDLVLSTVAGIIEKLK